MPVRTLTKLLGFINLQDYNSFGALLPLVDNEFLKKVGDVLPNIKGLEYLLIISTALPVIIQLNKTIYLHNKTHPTLVSAGCLELIVWNKTN